MKYIDLAKRAYEAYAESTEWKNFQGTRMPEWDALPNSIKNAWVAASANVVQDTLDDVESATEMVRTEIVPRTSTI